MKKRGRAEERGGSGGGGGGWDGQGGPAVDARGVVRCPALHPPGLEAQGNTGVVRAVLPVEGRIVAAGEAVLRIETDFAHVDIPSPIDGIVDEVLVHAGQRVSKGDPLWRYLER
ncbi:MAG: biotin/lipoyl-binding protein [Phycisphaerales bacterium]|nr:biotin/lipoyl-binding protein [Phycisphaerales bacterium]